MRVSNRWQVRRWLEVRHAVRVDRDGALSAPGLFSPEASVRAEVVKGTFLSVSASQAMSGPRTDALLPGTAGAPWVPPMHPFASSAAWRADVSPETVRTSRVGFDHAIAANDDVSAGVEWFTQTLDDQMAIVFGSNPSRREEYDVVTVGDASLSGWRVRVRGVLLSRLTGAVEFAWAEARWRPGGVTPSRDSSPIRRLGTDRVEDLSTSFSWVVPRTSTLIGFTHRISRIRRVDPDLPSNALRRQRIALEFQQRAPFQPLAAGVVNFFVDLRTAFYDDESASLYDEALTVRNPARVSGGLQVQF